MLIHPAIVSLAIVWALFAPPVVAWFYLRFVGRIMLDIMINPVSKWQAIGRAFMGEEFKDMIVATALAIEEERLAKLKR